MQRLLYITLYLVTLFSINSCAHGLNINKSLSKVKKSIVKIEVWMLQEVCNDEEKICGEYSIYATGSGSVLQYHNTSAVLTAAHVCQASKSISEYFISNGAEIIIKAIDRDDRNHIIKIIKIDKSLDVCLLKFIDESVKIPELKISRKKPEYGERVYNLAAPLSIIKQEMVPVFEGFYMEEDINNAFYSIPVISGSSGSPIVNSRGEIVGMIHSVHRAFHHISLSVTYSNLWNFIKDININFLSTPVH